MGSGIGSLHKILKDETRRRIILLLQEKGSLGYVDMMKALGITNTGKMNYHLKVLGNLLTKRDDGQYGLSDRGVLASRLLQEFSEANTARRIRHDSRDPQVFWGGVIICGLALIGWLFLYRFFGYLFTSGSAASDVEPSAPFIFVLTVFSFIGLYMIVSDLKKAWKASRILTMRARNAVIPFTVALVVLGMSLVGVSGALPDSTVHLMANQKNPGANYTIFSNAASDYTVDLVIGNLASLDQKTIYVTITNLEQNQTWTAFRGTASTLGETLQLDLLLSAGHNEIKWNELNVTQITVYLTPAASYNLTRLVLWTAGLSILLVGAVSLFGFEVDRLSEWGKTGFFWWGLIIAGLALSWLFEVLWVGIFPSYAAIYMWGTTSLGSPYSIIPILIILVFLFVGFRLMKEGAIKKGQTDAAIGSRLSALEFYLRQRNYRALVYLLFSALITVWTLETGSLAGYLIYINLLGLTLLFLFYGPPSMYGWINVHAILPYALLIFGLFVEIFIVCELFVFLMNLTGRTREPESSISQRLPKKERHDPGQVSRCFSFLTSCLIPYYECVG